MTPDEERRSKISDLYKQYFNRAARPDELEFHISRGTDTSGRLQPWLRSQKKAQLEKDIETGASALQKRSLGSYDLETKLLEKLRQDKGLQDAKARYYNAPDELRARGDWGDMTPQQRRRLEAQAQTGALQDVRAQGGALKDILGTLSTGYEKTLAAEQLAQEQKESLLEKLIGEQQAEAEAAQQEFENNLAMQELALKQAQSGGYGGGYGYGSAVDDTLAAAEQEYRSIAAQIEQAKQNGMSREEIEQGLRAGQFGSGVYQDPNDFYEFIEGTPTQHDIDAETKQRADEWGEKARKLQPNNPLGMLLSGMTGGKIKY